jgi:hypothetical protein
MHEEDNWTRCERLAREIPPAEIIRQLLLQIHRMRKRADKGLPLWSFVGEATNHGSGVSAAICSVYGINPDSGVEAPAPTTDTDTDTKGGEA